MESLDTGRGQFYSEDDVRRAEANLPACDIDPKRIPKEVEAGIDRVLARLESGEEFDETVLKQELTRIMGQEEDGKVPTLEEALEGLEKKIGENKKAFKKLSSGEKAQRATENLEVDLQAGMNKAADSVEAQDEALKEALEAVKTQRTQKLAGEDRNDGDEASL